MCKGIAGSDPPIPLKYQPVKTERLDWKRGMLQHNAAIFNHLAAFSGKRRAWFFVTQLNKAAIGRIL